MKNQNIEPPISKVTMQLQTVLTQQIVAYSIGFDDGRDIGKIAREEIVPSPEIEEKLRFLSCVVEILKSSDGDQTIRSWMLGMKDWLNDESPASIIRTGDPKSKELESILESARAFVLTG